MNSNNAINNPTDSDRHEILKYLLNIENRSEDFSYIVEAMKPPKDITSICEKNLGGKAKVAIIGAGEAGLSAAFELRKIGCNITIFEATRRIGGRVYTHYFDRNKNDFGELGAMSIPISHETTWHYINLFNLSTTPLVSNNVNTLFYIRDSIAANDLKGRNVYKNIYPKFDLSKNENKKRWMELRNLVYENYLKRIPSNLRKELVQNKENYSEVIKELDKLTLREAYEKMNFSNEAISMLSLLDGSKELLNLSFIESLERYYTEDSKYTYKINDGMINIPISLYEALSNINLKGYKGLLKEDLGEATIKLQCAVSGIYNLQNSSKVSIKYNDIITDRDNLEEFDYVICAIPFTSLRRVEIKPLLTNIKCEAINNMNYEVSQKTYLYFKERFWEKGRSSKKILGGISYTDLPLVSIYYPTNNKRSYKEEGVLLGSYSFGKGALVIGSEDSKMQIEDVIRYIGKIHGLSESYLYKNLIDYKSLIWSDIQYIWGAGAYYNSKDKELYLDKLTVGEMDNKVYFAGEHISGKHMSQQGALRSGMVAANKVAERIAENK
ncbi:MAG: NAD(P)-binding protein [Clostridiales bacterium]|nr:NAD(P)-binding protein [Clostridiales bacterium]